MRIIKQVEVHYLRSLYSARLIDVGDLNVIFGRNDSGKSNLLRALNLFFNDQIEPTRRFDFELDMSDLRRREAREAKGRQFLWIKITFNVRENYRKSLGDEFTVKKQWNRDGDVNTFFYLAPDRTGQQGRATRYLNDISFTYIPAIKDLDVYADLIERVYGAASESGTLQEATRNFIDAISAETTSLSQQLTHLFGAEARLAPPTEMQKLFRSLDFAHGEERHSLLRQKGDGIKARHLPELLRFVNENERRTRLYLWGFEEPENSLDLGAAEEEASRFADFASRDDTQVFITSHSPAFYLTEGGAETEIRRFFVTKQLYQGDKVLPYNAVLRINKLDEAEEQMQDAGLLQLPFLIRRMQEQRDELRRLASETERLGAELAALNRPTIFVEGKHDVHMFESALMRGQFTTQIDVKELRGAPTTEKELLAAVLRQGGLTSEKCTFFLFDNDKKGRKAYEEICGSKPDTAPVEFARNIFVWVLPTTEEFEEFARRYGLEAREIFFTAELLYPVNDSARLCVELAKKPGNEKELKTLANIHGDYWKNLKQENGRSLANAEVGSPDWFYARGVPDGLKGHFAKEASRRNFSTSAIDAVAKTVCNTLIGS